MDGEWLIVAGCLIGIALVVGWMRRPGDDPADDPQTETFLAILASPVKTAAERSAASALRELLTSVRHLPRR